MIQITNFFPCKKVQIEKCDSCFAIILFTGSNRCFNRCLKKMQVMFEIENVRAKEPYYRKKIHRRYKIHCSQ